MSGTGMLRGFLVVATLDRCQRIRLNTGAGKQEEGSDSNHSGPRTRFQSISMRPGIPVLYNGELVRVVVVVLSDPIITALGCPPS